MRFSDFGLDARTLRALEEMGYEEPTEVQAKTIPLVLEGKDLIVRSHTGTGKTAAFGIGMVDRISSGASGSCLVLAPTRELAIQVCKELRAIGKEHGLRIHVVYGGQSINIQIDALRGGVDVLVATPGRLLDLHRRGVVDISSFDAVVLDEADHMLDLGFQDEMDDILKLLPQRKLMLLLSATIDASILRIASKHLTAPQTIEVGEVEVVSTVTEEHVEATDREKFKRLLGILEENRGTKTLIFRETKRGASDLQERLYRNGFKESGLLQGDMTQAKRSAVLSGFREGKLSILVATNVAARGLHIDNLDLIINYDRAQDEETHVHRVGRTGRMGNEGRVINFMVRKETVDERMHADHPDFQWMREGLASYRQGRERSGRDGDRRRGGERGRDARRSGHGGGGERSRRPRPRRGPRRERRD